MAYSKTNWSPTVAITPSNLNKMEQGIFDNDANIGKLQSNMSDISGEISELNSNLTDLQYSDVAG